jgi:hypothetical protein
MEKLNIEINELRKLMGLSLLSEEVEIDTQSIIDTLFKTNSDEIQKLLDKSDKTLEELMSGEYLTLTDINTLFKIAKLSNNSSYNKIVSQITETEEYKNLLINQFNLSIDEFSKKMTSDTKISKYDYSSIIKQFSESYAKLIGAKFINTEKIILDYYLSTVVGLWDDYDLNEVSNEYLKNAYDSTDFYSFTTSQPNYSGWKIYIYAENYKDVIEILQTSGDYIKSTNYPFKVGTNQGLNKKTGKGVIMYIPYSEVVNKTFKQVFNGLNQKLTNYPKKGNIGGTKSYSGPLFYSYEFNKKFKNLPKDGVKVNELNKYYVPNDGGDYMKGIKQKDLFDE